MIRILHISDSHAQSETMARLNNLAELCSDCDVVALTGDCASLSTRQVPLEWDAWPQALKLAVAGNHDEPNTFELLESWVHWDHEPHAFTRPRWRERKYVFGAVVTEIL